MTLKFEYFQYEEEYFMFMGLPQIISSICFALLYSFIFLSVKKRNEELHKPEYLKYFAIIAMVSAFIPLFFPGFYYVNLTDNERLLIRDFFIFQGLIYSLPSFIAGVFLFVYGHSNRNKFGLYLLIGGILWMIYYGTSIITLNWGIGNMFSYLLHLEPATTDFERFIYVLRSFFQILFASTFCLFIIHGARNSDYMFIYAGLTILIANYVVSFFSTVGFFYFRF
jgi:hypothetical protein